MDNWLAKLSQQALSDEETLQRAINELPPEELYELSLDAGIVEPTKHVDEMEAQYNQADQMGRELAHIHGDQLEKSAWIAPLVAGAGRLLAGQGAKALVGSGAKALAGDVAKSAVTDAATSAAGKLFRPAQRPRQMEVPLAKMGGIIQSATTAVGGSQGLKSLGKDILRNTAVNKGTEMASNALSRKPQQAVVGGQVMGQQPFSYGKFASALLVKRANIAQTIAGHAMKNPGHALAAAGALTGAVTAKRDPQTGQKDYAGGALKGLGVGLGAHYLGAGKGLKSGLTEKKWLGENAAKYLQKAEEGISKTSSDDLEVLKIAAYLEFRKTAGVASPGITSAAGGLGKALNWAVHPENRRIATALGSAGAAGIGTMLFGQQDPMTGEKHYLRNMGLAGAAGYAAGDKLLGAAQEGGLGGGAQKFMQDAAKHHGTPGGVAPAAAGAPPIAHVPESSTPPVHQGKQDSGVEIGGPNAPVQGPQLNEAQKAGHDAMMGGMATPANSLHPDYMVEHGGMKVRAGDLHDTMIRNGQVHGNVSIPAQASAPALPAAIQDPAPNALAAQAAAGSPAPAFAPAGPNQMMGNSQQAAGMAQAGGIAPASPEAPPLSAPFSSQVDQFGQPRVTDLSGQNLPPAQQSAVQGQVSDVVAREMLARQQQPQRFYKAASLAMSSPVERIKLAAMQHLNWNPQTGGMTRKYLTPDLASNVRFGGEGSLADIGAGNIPAGATMPVHSGGVRHPGIAPAQQSSPMPAAPFNTQGVWSSASGARRPGTPPPPPAAAMQARPAAHPAGTQAAALSIPPRRATPPPIPAAALRPALSKIAVAGGPSGGRWTTKEVHHRFGGPHHENERSSTETGRKWGARAGLSLGTIGGTAVGLLAASRIGRPGAMARAAIPAAAIGGAIGATAGGLLGRGVGGVLGRNIGVAKGPDKK